MANRSHLYVFDKFEAGMPVAPRGLHEWSSDIPISHLLMMSGRPRKYASSIVTGRNLAVVADYEPGVQRLLAFLHALEASKVLPGDFGEDVRAAEAFLAQPSARGRFVLLEPFEIFQFEQTAPEEQCLRLIEKRIPKLVEQVDLLLAEPPERMFSRAPKWLADIRKDWQASIGLGEWSSILYYSLAPRE